MDRIWQWAWDRYAARYSWAVSPILAGLSLPHYLLMSWVIVAFEGSDRYAESAAITTGSGAAAWPWELHWEGIVTATGTSGSMTGCGSLQLGTSLTAYSTNPCPTTAAARAVAIDTTIARAIGVCATWGTSSASNTLKVYKHSVMIKN
jgi:hypothetical protein